MTEWLRKVSKGETPTPEDWIQHLQAAHRDRPGMTPETLAPYRDSNGLCSYSHLAKEVIGAEPCTIVDLACGNGHLIPFLRKAAPKAQIWGADMSIEELNLARSNKELNGVEFIECMAHRLPFANQSVDHVVCHMAFMLMMPLEPVVAEVARVLRPGGTFSAVMGSKASDPLMVDIQKICLDFTDRRFPFRSQVQRGDGRVATVEGLNQIFTCAQGFAPVDQLEEIRLQIELKPDGIWRFMRFMYFVTILPPEDQQELQRKLRVFADNHSDKDGTIRLTYPLKKFKVRRDGDPCRT
ncbi:MAG: class I SAM-dependent methyltransferase [Bdellovibrionales bacterium]